MGHRDGVPAVGLPVRPAVKLRAPGYVALVALVGLWDLPQSLGQSPQPSSPPAQDQPANPDQLPKINPDGWTASAVCGECHQAIHAVWRQSLHATAYSNGVFQAGYRRAIEAHGAEQARVCLSCHAPTVRFGKDYEVKNPLTAEGITCDFCHSVSAVDLSDPVDPVRWSVGKVKYGPLLHAQSPAHQIVDSQLHTRSEFCAACHEYKNAHGVTVLGTYSEWKQSPYPAQGKRCQDCHMPLVPGRVVALSVKSNTPTSVNLHDISGSHDIEWVRKAVSLELAGYEWIGDRAWVSLKVTNKGSGHCFPTGLPKHRAVLEVTVADDNGVVDRRDIPFEIVLEDDERRILQREHDMFITASHVRSDTRLRPSEARAVDVSFRDIKAKRLTMNAALYYEYSTEALVTEQGENRIQPVEMKFLVASLQGAMKPSGR